MCAGPLLHDTTMHTRFAFGLLALLATGCAVEPMAPAARCQSPVANAFYAGPYKGAENRLDAQDHARDWHCAGAFRAQRYPKGFVAVYGSSRIGEASRTRDAELNAANDRVYTEIRRFAATWTRMHGKALPILHGAGPGLMEAAARGAVEAGGPSIGYTTYYGPAHSGSGDAKLAFHKLKGADGRETDLTTDGLIFSSVAAREAAMIAHSAAIIVGPGGTGTEWEIFQILESLKSQQLDRVPMYLIGNRQIHWASFEARLNDLVARGTVRKEEVADLFEYVDGADALAEKLKQRLGLP